jgi:hypothetical protein
MKAGRVALLFALSALATACRGQSVDARSNFVEDGVQLVAAAAWTGERIEIVNLGVTAGGGLGLSAISTDRVVATARLLAIADTTDKSNADRTIDGVTKGFTVSTTAGLTSVQCGHGTQNGSAAAADSGCDALDVSFPVGRADQRLSVVARSGYGKVGIVVDSAQLAELTLNASHGTIDVKTGTTQGASITIISETGDDITLRLPPDFQADAIVLDAPPEKIDTSAFPDLQNGKGRGTAGGGAKLIAIHTHVAGGATGHILVVPIVPE